MSELTAGREALDRIQSLPDDQAVHHLAMALQGVLELAEGWHGEYAGRNVNSNAEYAYTDGRDDAALELEMKLVAVAEGADLLIPVSSGS